MCERWRLMQYASLTSSQDRGMESETNENNNNIDKVEVNQQVENDVKKKSEHSEQISSHQQLDQSDEANIASKITESESSEHKVVSHKPANEKIENNSVGESQQVFQIHEKHHESDEPKNTTRLKSADGLAYEPSDNDSEPEGEYSFTEDQKRAMMELMVQKHEDGDIIDEDPPEYNVKGRLIQLNAELANDPTPLEANRETRVGFKPEIVDLVAPPPSYLSDDESQPDSARGDKPVTSPVTDNDPEKVEIKESARPSNETKESARPSNNEQYVVERDGNFTVLSAKELTPSERQLYISDKDKDDNDKTGSKGSVTQEKAQEEKDASQSTTKRTAVIPKPPSQPRPYTAATGTRRKTTQSTRPKSAVSDHSCDFSNPDYTSPYSLSKEEKEKARRDAKRLEEERNEKERRKNEEEEERRKENMSAFEEWLRKKKEEDKNKKQTDEQKDEQQRKEENEEAYKTWLKEKHSQVKKEKLLRRRQQQERNENYSIHTQDDCDKAFKEWLKKKNLEMKKQNAVERQKSKLYKLYQRRSRRACALLKALKEVQSSPYLDYYGYRF
ncbi:hypothetical protein Btru_000902 [Bulinus truncatus]|nr:hypothetical protein Btru_000902 [Bulinus truncatus]